MSNRQSSYWTNIRERHPRQLALVVVVVSLSLAADVGLLLRYGRYQREVERLREGMTEAQRQRADLVMEAERHRVRVELDLIRRQARTDGQLHLAVNVDSGTMVLEHAGTTLREMSAEIGPLRIPGAAADTTIAVPPLGERTVARVLDRNDAWDVPAHVWEERGLSVPSKRRIPGALGRAAIVLNSGTVIYAAPDSGLLADAAVLLPGSVRIARADMLAIVESVRPGISVYFYR